MPEDDRLERNYKMEDFITVLSVGKPYDIAPESGVGEHVIGCTMSYVATQDISSNHVDEETGTLGYTPLKERMPVEFYERAKSQGLPSVAKVVYGMKTSGGKTVLYIKGLDFVPFSGAKASK